MHRVTQHLVREGEVLVISMPGKEVPERHSSQRPSDKQLLEWHSNMFSHKNTSAYHYIMTLFRILVPCYVLIFSFIYIYI
jgi:hypothetical protein